MHPKDIAETAAYLVAAVGGPIAAFWALIQWRDSIRQRKLEHRWRQAEVGRQLINQLFDDDSEAGAALEILDGERDQLDMPDGSVVSVSADDIRKALATASDKFAKSRQIRRSFDALFYHLERFQHMIDIELVTRADILKPTQYYCQRLMPLSSVIDGYLREVGYTKALALISSLQAVEPAHSPEAAAGPESNGKSSPPAP